MSKFLLVYPPSTSFFIDETKVFYGLSPPLGLLSIASILEQNGDYVKVLDFSAEPYHEYRLIKEMHNVDAIGMTVISPSLSFVTSLVRVIKQHDPHIPIIIGGPHCTLAPENALVETQADISVQGDGEKVIQDITLALNKKKALSEIPGITYRTSAGIKHGPSPQCIEDLDTLLFPARRLVKHYTYGRQYNPRMKPGDFTTIMMSRGCPFSCIFCSHSAVSMQRYRTRTVQNIIEELREIHEQGYHHVAIIDDCFPSTIKQAHAVFDAILNEHLPLQYSITATRVDLAEKELYKKMKKAGVIHIQFGLESGNQDVLDFYHKQTTIDMIRNAVGLSHETGFFTMGSFILGAPFETVQHLQNTISFAKSLPLDSVSFLPLRYMIGSELWNNAVADGKIMANEYIVSADKNRGLGTFTQEELFRYCKMGQQAFYRRPTFWINLLKTSIRNNDMSFIRSYFSILHSAFQERFHV